VQVRAIAKQVRGSPQKVRLVLNVVRGRPVEEALTLLKFIPSPAARKVAKVVKSATSNAENNYQMSPAQLRIVKACADEGPRMKRFRPQARGRISPIIKRTTHITVVVEEREE